MNQAPVCIVDDDSSAREAVGSLVRSAGLLVETFGSAREFLERPEGSSPACLVLDVDLPGLNGLELQAELQRTGQDIPIIFVTGHGDIPMSVRAVKAGAIEFFTKPFNADDLLNAIEQGIARTAAAVRRRSEAALVGRPGAPRTDQRCSEIVGSSTALEKILHQVRTVARTESTVLIHGETGTGKELIARALHNLSSQKNGPFVKVNCAAIPAGLLESELMGHEKGAFTGALARRIGRFELAQGGTIFLDEIGEMAIDLQPKLLRLLQEREFERVGGTTTMRWNARLVAATNRDLKAMVAERLFREDLYYRLNVFPVDMPPLRERRDDIPALVRHFVGEFATRMDKEIDLIPPDVMDRLTAYDWPGNIRELQNVLERSVILSDAGSLSVPSLTATPASSRAPSAAGAPPAPSGVSPVSERSDELAEISRAHILSVLDATNWRVAGPDGAAARLGMKRSTLNFRMKKLGIFRHRNAVAIA